MKISIIAAVAENNVIGKNNQLVWHLPADMNYFRGKTIEHCVIMGRKNYDSIPDKFRPLSGRTNIIITRQKKFFAPGCIVVNSIKSALEEASNRNETECFIIGGAEIYKQTIGICDYLYYTKVHASFDGDAFFPAVDWSKWEQMSQKDFQPDEKHDYSFSICELSRKIEKNLKDFIHLHKRK